MSEKIIKPEWFLNSGYIKYSNNLKKFMTIFNLEDLHNVDIELLRNYYKNDKEECLTLIDELILRGFKFEIKEANNLLKNIEITECNEIIINQEDKQRYKNIDFDRIGVSNFIKRFKVDNDYFFNYIKIDYFLYLNRDININILKEELNKNAINYTLYNNSLIEELVINNTIKIKDVFYENIFNKFIEYCDDNGLENIDDLYNFDFDKLYLVKGLGESKISKIKCIYDNINKENGSQLSSNSNIQYDVPSREKKIIIDKGFYKSSIDSLYFFDIPKNVLQRLQSDFNINNMEDFQNYKLSDLTSSKYLGKSKLNKLEEAILRLNENPNDIYIDMFNKIKELENFDIYKLRCRNITLNRIGIEQGVSRERIRQKESKITDILISYFELFGDYFKSCLENKLCITDEDISFLFNEQEDIVYIEKAIKNGLFKEYIYVEKLDKVINKVYIDIINELLDFIRENMPNIFKIEDELDNINDIISSYNVEFLNEDDIIFYLTKYGGYKKINNYLWKNSYTLGKLYAFIIKEYFPKGISIYTDEINDFKSIINNEFGLDIDRSNGTIRNIIINEEEIVLYDKGTYIHSENINISIKLLNEIRDYINSCKRNTIAITDIYSKFEYQLQLDSNIDNRYFLQGTIKYYYKDEYKFSKDMICKNGEFKSCNQILERYLYDKNRCVNLKELKSEFPGWTPIMFSNAVDLNENILLWDFGSYIHRNNISVSKEEINIMENILEKEFAKENIEYITVYNIFNKMKLKIHSVFKNNNIKNPNNLFYLLELFFKDKYVFKRNVIYKNGLKEYNSVFKIYGSERDIIDYDEFCQYFKNLKLKDSTIYGGFRRLKKDFIQISLNSYIKIGCLNLCDNNIKKIREFIKNKLVEKPYVDIYNIINFSELPNIGYEWSNYILLEVIERYIPEFKVIESKFKDRRYRRPIIVKNDSDIQDIVDVIIYIIKYEYNDVENLTVGKIKDYLITNNIFVQSIPNEFFESEKILVDEYGRVAIKEKNNGNN